MLEALFILAMTSAQNTSRAKIIDYSAPEERRVEQLSAYFSPRPQDGIEIPIIKPSRDPNFQFDQGRTFIKINPPKDRCFTITLSKEQQDKQICSSAKFYFSLGDLDEFGNLKISVKIDQDLEETLVSWQSPHRVIKYNEFKSEKDKKYYLHHCRKIFNEDNSKSNKFDIYLTNGMHWKFIVPEVEIPFTPEASKNLFIANKIERKKEYMTLDMANKTVIAKTVEQIVDWDIKDKNAFLTKAQAFTSNYSAPPGTVNGICRYRYHKANLKNQFGALECRDTNEFSYIFIPLPCLVQSD
ncbi:MAG: hypothetical protein KBD78_10965 [Oligoflexales bacterium]|nr:hypothetical protein [Oligoflexales bacterium]